jgi:DNA repair exonuclease SbcCD nuclease subunit
MALQDIGKQHLFEGLSRSSTIALLADPHFNIFQKHNRFFKHMEDMMSAFAGLCIKEKAELIVLLGDMFDTKSSVNTDGLIRVNRMVDELSRIAPMIIIPGNHDLAFFNQAEISLPENYKYYERVVVITEPMILKITGGHDLIFVPFSNTISSVLEEIKTEINPKHKTDLFSHFGVTTFKVHDYSSIAINNAAAQIAIQSLSAFNQVFLGHYHGYQTARNVTYVSSPLQSRHGDEASQHGFVIYNLKTKTHMFHENTVTPKFVTYELNKTTVKEMLTLHDHYIRIRVTKKVPKELLISLRQKLMVNNFEVKIVMDIPDVMKLSTIKGWNEIVFNDDETLITNYLKKLENENKLPHNKAKLLEHLEINIK